MARKARATNEKLPADYLTRLGEMDFNFVRTARPSKVRLAGVVYTYDAAAAARAVRFIECYCRHYIGDLAGELMRLEPWQKWIVEELFGWKRADGKRRYRKAFIFVPRKNGKTQLLAAIALYLMMADHESGAKVYAAAADKEQARLLFDAASMMVEQDEDLQRQVIVHKEALTYYRKRSSTYVLSSKPNTKHGLNAHGILIDELHAHESRDLFDVLMTSRGARKRSMAIVITTAGSYDENSICWNEYAHAKRVAQDPEVNPTLLPVLFEAPRDMDWRDEATWHYANPGLRGGHMIQLDYMQEECRKAIDDPSYENTFRQLQLNQWTEQSVRAIPMHRWNECAAEAPFPLEGRRCFIGIDRSQTTDLTCVSEVYPFEMDSPSGDSASTWGVWVRCHFWTPKHNIERRERTDNASYRLWAKRGSITIVDEAAVPEYVIEDHVRKLMQSRNVERIVFDRWGMTGIGSRMANEYGEYRIAEQRQGFWLSPAWKEMMGGILTGRFLHEPNETLDYCAANVAIKTDDLGNVKPVKSLSAGRIDGIVATLTALSHVMQEPLGVQYKRSVYDTGGVTLL